MITRAAILIEASNLAGEQDLPGARVDIDNWRAHLTSNWGGAWSPSEINVLSKPSLVALKLRLAFCADKDYVFITFSGHGDHLQAKDIDDTRLYINDKDVIYVRELNPGNSRCTIVADCCRKIVSPEPILEGKTVLGKALGGVPSSRQKYRELFETEIMKCEKGAIELYSCDLDEAAGESSRSGGYYSRFIAACCEEWHSRVSDGAKSVYRINEAHECAAEKTNDRARQQHPQYEGGRRLKHFPLAVRP